MLEGGIIRVRALASSYLSGHSGQETVIEIPTASCNGIFSYELRNCRYFGIKRPLGHRDAVSLM